MTRVKSGERVGRPTHTFQSALSAYNAVRLCEAHVRRVLAACDRALANGHLNGELDFHATHVHEFIDAAHHFLETLNAEPWQLLGREDKG
jgi:hypothetical protein